MVKTLAISIIIFLLLAFTLSEASTNITTTDPGDAAAMHVIAASVKADSALNWSPPSDPCTQWPGVKCGGGGKVTAIQLGYVHNLSGSIPPDIGNLTALQRLELQFVGLGGPLPSLKGLSDLTVLLLHDNRFTSIPDDFFSGLSSLSAVNFDQNPFQPWVIPESLKDCYALQNFSAINASVVGGVPEFFGTAFRSLAQLRLANNKLGGEIPQSFANLGVKRLWLNGAGLVGGIDVIADMTNLKDVLLQSNSLMGPLPDFSMMGDLQSLNLRDNQLTGIVPKSLTELKSLQNVSLTNNLLQGPMPVFGSGVSLDLELGSESFCHGWSNDCDPRVNILLSIVGSFGYPKKFAQDWKNNDPCSDWLGISCDHSGNITAVNFQRMNLSGVISPEFESLGSLQKLILSGNNLTGTIPPGLVNLKLLKILDVSNNALSGEVPTFTSNVAVNTDGNPNIQKNTGGGSAPSSPPSPDIGGTSNSTDSGNSSNSDSNSNGNKSNAGVIVGCIVAALIGIIGLLIFCYRRKKREIKFTGLSMPSAVIHPRADILKVSVVGLNGGETTNPETGKIQVLEPINLVYSIKILREATNNFSDDNILGRGGFGTVYKGILKDGNIIAVKRMESASTELDPRSLSEFKSEISILTKVRHKHLVSLLGYCLIGNERILVYEYMPQGTLSQHLFHRAKAGLLNWKIRLTIALDVARGVEYLHSMMTQSFIHRDLKSSNILLGEDMRAKVADFGLIRNAPEGTMFMSIAGTYGYLSPEVAVMGRVTTKSDVYSFGVILMELLTGRQALDKTRPEDQVLLATWFRNFVKLNTEEYLMQAIDPAIDIRDPEISSHVKTVSVLAGHCAAHDPGQRPDMSYAVNTLSSLCEKWKPAVKENANNEIDIQKSWDRVLGVYRNNQNN